MSSSLQICPLSLPIGNPLARARHIYSEIQAMRTKDFIGLTVAFSLLAMGSCNSKAPQGPIVRTPSKPVVVHGPAEPIVVHGPETPIVIPAPPEPIVVGRRGAEAE